MSGLTSFTISSPRTATDIPIPNSWSSTYFTIAFSDRAYDNVLRHLGGLRPGERKEFRPWKD